MELALEDAGITPGDVAHINAHGTSTPLNDLAEAQAIEKLFGTPSAAGHLDQGRHRALARRGRCDRGRRGLPHLERSLIPPTVGLEELDPEITIDVVTGSRAPSPPVPSSPTASASAATTAASCSVRSHPEHRLSEPRSPG
jgi:3-oxoacyl-[acyl-carrier-protein] synthase II